MIMRTTLASYFLLSFIFSSFASAEIDYRFASTEEVQLLKKHLDLLKTDPLRYESESEIAPIPGETNKTGQFLVSLITELRATFHWCEDVENFIPSQMECIKTNYENVVFQAKKDQVIDPIESAHLVHFSRIITLKENLIDTDSSFYFPIMGKRAHLGNNEAPLPRFEAYLTHKRYFEKSREAKGQNKSFNQTFLKQTGKMYRKNIYGIGRTDAISYTLALYPDTRQINALSGVMTKYLKLATAREASYRSIAVDGEVIDLPIKGHQKSIAAYCFLKHDLKILSQDKTKDAATKLFRKSPTPEEALMSSVITGEFPIEWAETLLSQKEFQTPNLTPAKILKTFYDVSRILLIAYPFSIPYYTFGNMIIQTIKQKKESENAAAAETDLFHCAD